MLRMQNKSYGTENPHMQNLTNVVTACSLAIGPPGHGWIGDHYLHNVMVSVRPCVTKMKTRYNCQQANVKRHLKMMTIYWLGPCGSLWSLPTCLIFLRHTPLISVETMGRSKARKIGLINDPLGRPAVPWFTLDFEVLGLNWVLN